MHYAGTQLDSTCSNASNKRRVVGLIRVSTADQARDDRGGIPRQRSIIEKTIAQKNLDCIRIYEISDVSGTQVLANSDIQEILQLVATGVATGLVVADLDRLFRPENPSDFAVLQAFKDTGAIIYSSDIEYHLDQKDSALFANIRSAISGFELQLIKERQQGAKEAKRRLGKCPNNYLTLPYGVSFDRKTEKWRYNDNIAKVIELFRLYDQEGMHNYSELGRRTGMLNVTVRNILRNPIYTGWRIIDQKRGEKLVSKTGKTYRRKVDRKPDEVIRTRVIDTPAVSQDCFDRVQASMARVRFNHLERRKKEVVHNLGTGVGRCGYCGEILYCSSGKRRTRKTRQAYYCCKANNYQHRDRLGGCKQQNIRQSKLDELIETFTIETLADPKTLTSIVIGSLQRSNEIISPFPGANVDAQITGLKKREKRLIDAYEEGEISLAELRSRREALKSEAANIKQREQANDRKPALDLEAFVRLLVRGAVRLKRMSSPSEKKAIIMSLFEEIYFKDKSITAFKFRHEVPLPGLSDAAAKTPIQLEQPFALQASGAEILPAGRKRCSCCKVIHPEDAFFKRRGQCKGCMKKLAAEAHQRRKRRRLGAIGALLSPSSFPAVHGTG